MAHCDEALRTIGLAIADYQSSHGGANPPTLPAMIEAAGLTPWLLVCPASTDGVGDCSYVYRGEDLDSTADKAMIIAYDKEPMHQERRNILFANWHVKRLREDHFEKAVAKDNQLRVQLGLAEKDI